MVNNTVGIGQAKIKLLSTMEAMANKPNRNTPCPCGSGLKYKKCCLNKIDNSSIRRVNENNEGVTFVGDVGKAVADIYSAWGLNVNASLDELAKKFNIKQRDDEVFYDSFIRITHPVIHRMIQGSLLRERGIDREIDRDARLNHLGYCLEFARHRGPPQWAESVLARIVKIKPDNKDAPIDYAACLAEFEHLLLLAGHGYFCNPVLQDPEIRRPDSHLIYNGKNIGIEVCSTAQFIEYEKHLAQLIAERFCLKLQNHYGNHYTFELPPNTLNKVLQEPKIISQAITDNPNFTRININEIVIRCRPIANSIPEVESRFKGADGFSQQTLGIKSGNEIRINFSQGIMVDVRILETPANKHQRIRKAIISAIRRKIKKKQVNLDDYDNGMLVIGIPYNKFIECDLDLQEILSAFSKFSIVADKEIKKSNRYQAVMLMAVSHKSKGTKTVTALRGHLVNGAAVGIKKTFFETVLHTEAVPLK